MRRDSNLLRRNALVSAVIIIFGSCGADAAPAEVAIDKPAPVVASGDEPAQVFLLAEAATSWFLDLDPPPPPGGRVVIARGAEGTENGLDDGAPVGEANAGVIEVAPEMMSALTAYGVTYPFVTLAEETGNARILLDPSYQSSGRGLPAPMVNRRGVQERSSIILAAHRPGPRCVGSLTSCRTRASDGAQCSEAQKHWFSWNPIMGMYCRGGECNC